MNAILENIVAPLVRRLGTAAATVLIAQGLDSALVEQLVNLLAGALLVGVDLLLARFYRQAVVTKLVGIDQGSPFGNVVGPLKKEAD